VISAKSLEGNVDAIVSIESSQFRQSMVQLLFGLPIDEAIGG
jgi:hypothetical protein